MGKRNSKAKAKLKVEEKVEEKAEEKEQLRVTGNKYLPESRETTLGKLSQFELIKKITTAEDEKLTVERRNGALEAGIIDMRTEFEQTKLENYRLKETIETINYLRKVLSMLEGRLHAAQKH